MTLAKAWLRIVLGQLLSTGILAAIGVILYCAYKLVISSRFVTWTVLVICLVVFLGGTFFDAIISTYKPTDHIQD